MSKIEIRHNTCFTEGEIRELVELLESFDKLCVYYCTQGFWAETADIYFYYGDDSICYSSWKSYLALAVFAKRLADAISIVTEETGGWESPLRFLNMNINWGYQNGFPVFYMQISVHVLAEITDLFYRVKKEFDNSVKGKKDINLSALITELS